MPLPFERASRKIDRKRMVAQQGRIRFGFVRRLPDQIWRSADGQIEQQRISTETGDRVLREAVAAEQQRLHLPADWRPRTAK